MKTTHSHHLRGYLEDFLLYEFILNTRLSFYKKPVYKKLGLRFRDFQ